MVLDFFASAASGITNIVANDKRIIRFFILNFSTILIKNKKSYA
jgi:hypothetical protein